MDPKKTSRIAGSLSALKRQFNSITGLMNTQQPLLIAGGNRLYTIKPESPYYQRVKAVLSDIGCDIAAQLHELYYEQRIISQPQSTSETKASNQ